MIARGCQRFGKGLLKVGLPVAVIVVFALYWSTFCGNLPHGDGYGPILGCLNEADLEQLRVYYASDPEGTVKEFQGAEFCLDLPADFVDKRPHAVGVALDLGYMGTTLLFTPEDQEDYRKILAWAEDPLGEERIKMVCTLTEFRAVAGGPEPVVLPDFNDCWVLRYGDTGENPAAAE